MNLQILTPASLGSPPQIHCRLLDGEGGAEPDRGGAERTEASEMGSPSTSDSHTQSRRHGQTDPRGLGHHGHSHHGSGPPGRQQRLCPHPEDRPARKNEADAHRTRGERLQMGREEDTQEGRRRTGHRFGSACGFLQKVPEGERSHRP